MKRYKVYVYNTVDKFWDCYEVLAEDPVDACKFLIIRGVLQVSVFEVNLKRSEVTESHDHSEGVLPVQGIHARRRHCRFRSGACSHL